jgi:exopolysaccharide biosynthesis predicted pyruvyltransferase EpsI
MKKIKTILKILFPDFFQKRLKSKNQKKYLKEIQHFKNIKKIVYTLVPSENHKNIGDQAQVVAILKWFEINFPHIPIVEVTKENCLNNVEVLKEIINDDDLIFIHSGGNLGNRFIEQEKGRRIIIKNFPANRIISLPQTIFFSKTETGLKELQLSQIIYNKHKKLTVIGRDIESAKIANELFPNIKSFALPDFVLFMDSFIVKKENNNSDGILFCLRNDSESNISKHDLIDFGRDLEMNFEISDTTIDDPISKDRRESILYETLSYFSKFKIIITDRYHGLIFASILRKPCLVISTVDHKLDSAIDWFKEIPYIKIVNEDNYKDLNKLIYMVINQRNSHSINWREKYFDPLIEKLDLTDYFTI